MCKWIIRTVGAVFIGAAFVAAGTGIANADSAESGQSASSAWDSALNEAMGPIRQVCNDLAVPYGRTNAAMCGELPRTSEGTSAPMTAAAPGNKRDEQAPDSPQPATAPQSTDPNSAEDPNPLGNADSPLLNGLQGLGLG